MPFTCLQPDRRTLSVVFPGDPIACQQSGILEVLALGISLLGVGARRSELRGLPNKIGGDEGARRQDFKTGIRGLLVKHQFNGATDPFELPCARLCPGLVSLVGDPMPKPEPRWQTCCDPLRMLRGLASYPASMDGLTGTRPLRIMEASFQKLKEMSPGCEDGALEPEKGIVATAGPTSVEACRMQSSATRTTLTLSHTPGSRHRSRASERLQSQRPDSGFSVSGLLALHVCCHRPKPHQRSEERQAAKGIGVIPRRALNRIPLDASKKLFLLLATDGVWEFLETPLVAAATAPALTSCFARLRHGLRKRKVWKTPMISASAMICRRC